MKHFIYKTSSPSGKYYIGRHSTANLDDGYLGSGKWIRSIKDKSSLSREIIAFAQNETELRELEERFINEAISDPNNMNFNNRSCGWPTGDLNWARSEKARKLKSNRKRGRSLIEEYGEEKASRIKEKISKSKTGKRTGKPAWNRGRPNSVETRKKISDSISSWMASMNSQERCEKFGNAGVDNGFYNKNHSEETLTHLKEIQRKNRQEKRKTCPHCNKSLDVANYAKYHGDRCKFKSSNPPSRHI